MDSLPFPGAIDHGGGRVTFALYAPGKRRVALLGDFNGWRPGADRLEPTEGGLWWTEKRLDPGRYAYRYVVNGRTAIPDPYARAVDHREGQEERSVIEVGTGVFEWRHDAFDRPRYEDLAVYEMHIGDFTPEGTFAAATQRLDYLRDLGINAVQVLPVFASPPDDHWGYRPVFYFAVEPRYGSTDDFRRFIDEAHARSIAVLMDLVLAHTDGSHPFARLYPVDRSPWYGKEPSEKNEFGFPSFDFRRPPARDLARDVQRYWLERLHIDGFRYDYLKLMRWQSDEGPGVLTGPARQCRADAYLIGECLPEDPPMVNRSDLNGAWCARFSRAFKALVNEKPTDREQFKPDEADRIFQILDHAQERYDRPHQRVLYLESHDEERIVREAMCSGFGEDTARRKSALAAAVLLTAPGVPMLYQGQEWGESTRKTLQSNKLRWELLQTPGGGGLHRHFRKLLHLRRDHPALRGPCLKLLLADRDRRLVACHRWTEAGDEALVIANFSSQVQHPAVPFPRPGRWHDAIADRWIEAGEGEQPVEVDRYAAAVLIRQPS